jgi:ribosomal peptide maturation radical SAM protein 1
VYAWTSEVAETLAGDYRAYGCTTSFEQNNASFALLGALRRRRPEVLTVLGGANAEGQLARGLASLGVVDVIFQGESEASFVQVLRDWREGRKPAARVVKGGLCRDLDALPEPDFDDFFDQVTTPRVDLPYEASRGCWWGQKSPCLFCAYEPEKFTFRAKSADRVLADWQALARRYPGLRVQTTDLIMPPGYFTTLLPRLAEADLPIELYWEQKADLTWDQLKLLKAAKVLEIQPGIENFASGLLGRIHKGTRPSKSLNLLRWAAMLGIRVYWNLLWGIPGETLEDYEPVLQLFRLIPHLTPPFGLSQLLVLRHSRYQAEPQRWGLDRVDPVGTFADVYPEGADLENLVTFYHPTYQAETLHSPEFFQTLYGLFTEWNQSFVGTDQRRVLFLLPQGPDAYLLLDTRRLGNPPAQPVDARRAASLLKSEPYRGTEDQVWALERRLAVVLDGDYVPLALSTPEVMEALVFSPR